MGFSHTSPTATQVLQHKCDQWASADAGIVRQDSPRASRPQAILKFRPPSSLDYKARHGPQTPFKVIAGKVCFGAGKKAEGMEFDEAFASICKNFPFFFFTVLS